jgi:hypothetical protein
VSKTNYKEKMARFISTIADPGDTVPITYTGLFIDAKSSRDTQQDLTQDRQNPPDNMYEQLLSYTGQQAKIGIHVIKVKYTKKDDTGTPVTVQNIHFKLRFVEFHKDNIIYFI